MNRTLLLIASAIALGGCQQTPVLTDAESQLESYLRSAKFTLFVPPRDGDGAGSIVSFNERREESIVASPAECFNPDRVAPATQRVGVLDSDYELTTKDKIVVGLLALFRSKLDFNTDLGRAGVRRVKYKLFEPYTTRITLISARNHFRVMPADDPCRKLVDNQRNLLIHTVLGAKGVEYSFYGENDARMTLTVEILRSLKADAQLSSKYAGTSSIQLRGDMLLGYRAWQLVDVKGFAVSGKDFVELAPEEIERVRAAGR